MNPNTHVRPVLYLVIPCYNEEKVLPITAPLFLTKINALISGDLISSDSRILFVNDGSKDRTWNIIQILSQESPYYCGISLSRNRGHQNALLAGLMEARDQCDITVSIDSDGQDDINAIDEMIAAYNDGEEWLDQAIAYVSDNKAYLEQFLRERIPQIRMIPSEGTYLVWLDCSQLPYRGMALEHFMINEAKVAFCAGYEFGKQGEAFLRMNVACPRCTLTKALEQMEKAINGLSLQ